MGHVRLGVLSKSRKWNQVVDELRLGAEVEAVAASAADAAERALQAASDDPAFLHTFWLLTQVPLAARGPDFADDLRRLGVQVPEHPGLMDVVAAISDCVDRHAREQGGTHRPRRNGPNGGCGDPCGIGRAGPAFTVRTQRGRGPAGDRTVRRWRPLQRPGAGVLRPPHAAEPRLLPQPRTRQPYRH